MPTDDRPLARARWLSTPEVLAVLDALEAGGDTVRFVGGAVRDTLLDPSVDEVDLDIATPVTPERNLALLAAAGIRTIPTGLAHGTITAIVGRRSFEITTLRIDAETDGRRARVAFTDCFDADAARRDFTINAMSCDRGGRLFDPFGGRADLAAGVIRFVGDPVARIREDYLRILRFFRFHARFGQVPPEEGARAALMAERSGLARLSGERIQVEILKMLRAPGVLAAIRLMNEFAIWQEVFGAEADVERLRALLVAAPDADPVLRLAALVRGRTAAVSIARHLRLANRDSRRLADLESAELPSLGLDAPALRALAYRLGKNRLRDRLRLAAAETRAGTDALATPLVTLDAFVPPRLPVDGHDLLARGVTGPAVGDRLAELETAWVESDFSLSRDMLLARLDAGLRAVPRS